MTASLKRPAVLTKGVPLNVAYVAVVLVHGRGASARDILTLADQLPQAASGIECRRDLGSW